MRVFIAVEVPRDVKQRLLAAAQRFGGRGVTAVKEDAMHLTVQFLGELDAEAVESVKKALSGMTYAPFRVGVRGIGSFGGGAPRVIFAGVAEGADKVAALHGMLVERLAAHGIALKREDFVPHITLARVKEHADFARLRGLLEKGDAEGFGEFEVGSLVLKKSTLSGEGPVYENLYELEF